MGPNRARDGSEGFQHQGGGGMTKRYLPRHRAADRQVPARPGIFRGGGSGGGGRRALAIARLVLLCCMATCAAGGFVLLAVWLHGSEDDGGVGKGGGSGGGRGAGMGSRAGQVLRFVPADLLRRFEVQGGIDGIRSEPRLGVRPPRLGIVSVLCVCVCVREYGCMCLSVYPSIFSSFSITVYSYVHLFSCFVCSVRLFVFHSSRSGLFFS